MAPFTENCGARNARIPPQLRPLRLGVASCRTRTRLTRPWLVEACVMIVEMKRVEVSLLGRFEVRVDDDPVPAAAWTHGRARDLVKLLALAPRHRLPRDRVLDALWPRLGVDAAMANLHKAAHHGRRTLGHAGGVVLRGGLVML